MYFGPGISVGRRGISYGDADAQAFISATGLTGTTEVNAVTNLVANLKTYGLWSKMKAIYPFVSDTTNLVSYSEEFTNAAWVRRRITVVDNAVASPLGTNTASTITEDSTTNTHEFGNPSAFTLSSSQNVTISIYVKKAGTRDWFAITMYNNSGVDKVGYYNISNGTLGNFDAGITGTITSIGNGWYRLSATGNFATTGNYFGFKGASANGTISYLGSGALQYYVWGAQLELGSTMTTYQPIATTPANRFVSQFKYNLKDPRDLDAAFRLAFNGTWAYSKQGATPNGVNGYANTYLNPSTVYSTNNSLALGYYTRDVATPSTKMGSADAGLGNGSYLIVSQAGTSYNRVTTSTSQVVGLIGTTPGLYALSRTTSTDFKYWRDTTLRNTASISSTGRTANPMWIGGVNYGGTAEYGTGQTAFNYIADGLTDSDISNMYTSVQQFNTDLNRYVGVPIVSDSDAQSFLNAAQITDLTQANAINTLVVGLKNASLWTKMKAIYPFVGGTATSHKWNLKDPRDLDAAYRLAFFGAWTHSSTGALPNGTNAYSNTYFNQQNSWTSTSNGSMGIYLRTNTVGAYCDMGAGTISTGANSSSIFARYTGDVIYSGLNCTTVVPGSANTDSRGFHAVSRLSSTGYSRYKRGTTTINLTNTDAIGTNINRSIYLGAGQDLTLPSNYSNREIAFSYLGDGLTQTEIDSLYTLVQNMETTLGRQV